MAIAPSSSSDLHTGSGTNDDDIVIQANNVERHSAFFLMSTAGVMDVYTSLDGTNYTTAPLALVDFGATSLDQVIETAAGRLYGWRGIFKHVRIRQKGADAVVNAALRCGWWGLSRG